MSSRAALRTIVGGQGRIRQTRSRGGARCRMLLVAGALAACGGDAPVEPSTTGNVVVASKTTGASPDQDGYTLTILDIQASIASNGGAVLLDVPLGEQVMDITGVAPNCEVFGGTSRVVIPGSPFPVELLVECVDPNP